VRLNKRHETKRKKIEGKEVSILVIPDMQIKPDVDLRFVYAIGEYIAAKRPQVVINLGDMADMPSLSSYDKGKRASEGQRYCHDIESAILAQGLLWLPTNDLNKGIEKRNKKSKKKEALYDPLRIFLEGNHCQRGDRATQDDPALYGTIDVKRDLKLDLFWDEIYSFLTIAKVADINFSHYFTSGVMGRACSSAAIQLRVALGSCISGHQPGLQIHNAKAADGRLATSIIAGSCYDFDLDYMGPQGNRHWRGVVMLHNAINGEFDPVFVPTSYLKQKYSDHLEPIIYTREE